MVNVRQCSQLLKGLVVIVALSAFTNQVEAKYIKWHVGKVLFQGNKTYNKHELIGLIDQRPGFWVLNRVRFSESRLRSDISSLRVFYVNHGFRAIDVNTEGVEYDTSKSQVIISILFHEGIRTTVSDVGVRTQKLFVDSTLTKALSTKVDSPLIIPRVQIDSRSLQDTLGNYGYLQAVVVPNISVDSGANKASVMYDIYDGPKIQVGDVRLKGAKDLRSSVILRELSFKQGDTLILSEIEKSRRRLYRTGLFNFIRIEPLLGDTIQGVASLPDGPYPILVSVNEADFFRIQTGVGYGTSEGLRASVQTSYNNFFALGHKVTFRGKASQKLQEAELIYSTPWLFTIPLQFDATTYIRNFNEELFQGVFNGFRFSLGKQTDIKITYQLWTDWKFVQWLHGTSPDTTKTVGVPKRNTQSVGIDLTYDNRDDVFNTTKGVTNIFGTEVAGLTGSNSNRFLKVTNTIRLYTTFKSLNLASSLYTGVIRPYGISSDSGISPDEIFYGGGSRSVRGFDRQKLRTDSSGNGVGGNVIVTTNLLDVTFPLFWWFYGAAFIDGGYIWPELKDVKSLSEVARDFRWSAGPGLRVNTPIAVVRLDVGFKLDRKSFEKDLVVYHLEIGQPF